MIKYIKTLTMLGLVLCCSHGMFAQNTFDIAPQNYSFFQDEVCGGQLLRYEVDGLTINTVVLPLDYQKDKELKYVWSFDEGTCASGQGNGGPDCNKFSEVEVQWQNVCKAGKVSCSVKLHYIDTNNNAKIKPLTVNPFNVQIVTLPSSISITGPSEVECHDNTVKTFNTTACAHEYSWSVQNGWSISSGQNTNSLKAFPSNLTATTVNLTTTYYCPTQAAQTLTASKVVTRECPTNASYLTATSTLPGHTAVDNDITVDATSGTIKVTSSQTKRMKAGGSILIKSNFDVEHGGFFTAKIEPCTDCYAFKNLSEAEGDVTDLENEDASAYIICPNPSDGHFTIGCQRTEASDDPVLITISDLQGRIVLQQQELKATSIPMNIQDQPAGMYVVRLDIGEQVFVQQIQKN